MKLVASVLLLVAIAYVEADCGCLQCSKHLYVATAPGSPIKVIYRGEPGVPLTFPQPPLPINIPMIPGKPCTVDQIVLQNYNPVYTVGLPSQCERTYDYKIETPVKVPTPLKDFCIPKPIKGVARVDRVVLPAPIIRYQPSHCKTCQRTVQQIRPIRQPIIEQLIPACSSPCANPCYTTYRYVSNDVTSSPCSSTIHIQDESEVVPENLIFNPFYVFLMRQNSYRSKRSTPKCSPSNTCQTDNSKTEDKCDDVNIKNYLESFGNHMDMDVDRKNTALNECSARTVTVDTDSLTPRIQESEDNNYDAKCARNKRHIPIISTGLNLLYNLLPPFIKVPLQQGLRSVQRDNNQHLAQQRRRRFQEDLLAQRQMRRYNPYVGIPSYYHTPKYYPFRQAPLPSPAPRRRQPSYYDNDIYAEELEHNFLSSLVEPKYMPSVYSRTRDEEYDDYDSSLRTKYGRRNDIFNRNSDISEITQQERIYDSNPRSKYGRRNEIFSRNSDRSDMTPQERNTFLKKLQKLNSRRYRRSVLENEDSSISDDKIRSKRAIVLDGSQLGLPFFRVTKLVGNDIDASDEHAESSQEYQSSNHFFREDTSGESMTGPILNKKKTKNKYREQAEEYLNPLDFDNLIPHNPIFYILNTPLRLLNHLHNFREKLSPVLQSVPKVLVRSRRYLQDFGKAFETDVMDFTSNIIGRFEDEPFYNYNPYQSVVTPARYRRSLPEETNTKNVKNMSLNSTRDNLDTNATESAVAETVDKKPQINLSEVSKQSIDSGNFNPEYEPVFNIIYNNKNDNVNTLLKDGKSNTEVHSHKQSSSEISKEKVISDGRYYPEYLPVFDSDQKIQSTIEIQRRFLTDHEHSSNMIPNIFNTYINKGHTINEKNLLTGKPISSNIDNNETIKDLAKEIKHKIISNGHYGPEYELLVNTGNTNEQNKSNSLRENSQDSTHVTTDKSIIQQDTNSRIKNTDSNKIETVSVKEHINSKENVNHVRKKRYLLKMVDDSEVASFIHDSLGQIMAPFYQHSDSNSDETVGQTYKKPCQNCYEDHDEYRPSKKSSKKQYVIEKLYPKIIIDNNGRPFIDIDGTKRPLIYKKDKKKCQKPGCYSSRDKKETKPCKYCGQRDSSEPDSLEQFNFESRISNLIEKAKKQAENQEDNSVSSSAQYSEMPVKTIKEEIKKLLTEIDTLVAMDFEPYLTIYNELLRLEHLKTSVCNEWKQMVMSDRINDMTCKIRLLDDFKKLQASKDEVVKSIAKVLKCDTNNFMAKKLIKMLVRLQKLQCIIFKAVEDAEEKLKCGSNFEINTEIKYIDYLCNLKFVVARSRHDLECDLKKERDEAVQKDMNRVEQLRELLEMPDDYEEINDLSRLLWEERNLEKLQHDTIESLNYKIKHKQKIRKELKILFDLTRQIETNEHKEDEMLRRTRKYKKYSHGYEYYPQKSDKYYDYVAKRAEMKDKYKNKRGSMKELVGAKPKRNSRASKVFRYHSFNEEQPVKLLSNGHSLRGYKFDNAFD